MFDENFDFRTKFQISTSISILDQISIFDQHFNFRPTFQFLTKFRFLAKIYIFDQNFVTRLTYISSEWYLCHKVYANPHCTSWLPPAVRQKRPRQKAPKVSCFFSWSNKISILNFRKLLFYFFKILGCMSEVSEFIYYSCHLTRDLFKIIHEL